MNRETVERVTNRIVRDRQSKEQPVNRDEIRRTVVEKAKRFEKKHES